MTDNNERNRNEVKRKIVRWIKIVVVCALLSLAACLRLLQQGLEITIEELEEKKAQQERMERPADMEQEKDGSVPSSGTVQPTLLTSLLHSHKETATLTGQSAGQAHWNLAQSVCGFGSWDTVYSTGKSTKFVSSLDIRTAGSSSGNGILPSPASSEECIAHVQLAAQQGHPDAQLFLAYAHTMGFWWFTTTSTNANTGLQVQEDSSMEHQNASTWALLHMSAIGGNTEAAMTLAHRFKIHEKSNRESCKRSLPYLEAAADQIIDQLEYSPESRAKVLPPMDRHVLHQIHLHGGSGSLLDYNNKPDETPELLQFYDTRVKDKDVVTSAQAAFALANFYHYGMRGITQNVTLALEYYEIAAKQGHWEAAGQAGMFHLFGIGTPQDAPKARRMFVIGTPGKIEGCMARHSRKIKNTKDETVHLCETSCVNGMGLIHLFGIPMVASVDHEKANLWFQLAKDQGSRDASYNIAMMKLGWKTHFQSIDVLDGKSQTALDEVLFDPSGIPKNHPSQGEYQQILAELIAAAAKGHVQAKHRLAKLYTYGVSIPTKGSSTVIVPKDCDKAAKNYRWVVTQASPQNSQRLRNAYKQYTAGNTADSLRNYLMAAETGSDLAQQNAAFLLEQGECLGMTRIDCAKASVRLWKAAAARGDVEANLRVGDFFYYGRLREDHVGTAGPFGWAKFIFFPEQTIPLFIERLATFVKRRFNGEHAPISDLVGQNTQNEHNLRRDLDRAAQYYRQAAEAGNSPRAYYTLGFLYEWGLGLSQDFHLAKRNYDLAVTVGQKEADLVVAIALFTLNLHELALKYIHAFEALVHDFYEKGAQSDGVLPSGLPLRRGMTKMDVISLHLFSWEAGLILVLTIIVCIVLIVRG